MLGQVCTCQRQSRPQMSCILPNMRAQLRVDEDLCTIRVPVAAAGLALGSLAGSSLHVLLVWLWCHGDLHAGPTHGDDRVAGNRAAL
eukprot:7906804-Alexandrium_andersonii.AAC.1